MRTSRNPLKQLAVLATLLCLVLALGGCRSLQVILPQADEPEVSPTLAMKGYELYSWRIQDDWYFALVPGTNRIKESEEVTSPDVRVQGLEALGEALDELPRGEQIFWSASLAPNMALADDTIVRQIEVLCRQRGITLHRTEAPTSLPLPPRATPTPIVLPQDTEKASTPPGPTASPLRSPSWS